MKRGLFWTKLNFKTETLFKTLKKNDFDELNG